MGVELFVVDDGWFIGRNDDTAGLGDWYVDPEKFPNGMNELIDEVHRLGMKFGLWIEPEMVNPKSRLFQNIRNGCSPIPTGRSSWPKSV